MCNMQKKYLLITVLQIWLLLTVVRIYKLYSYYIMYVDASVLVSE